MKRLLIIGNSHVGALKAGWDAMAHRPASVAVDFLVTVDAYLNVFDVAPDGRFGILDRNSLPPAHVRQAEAVNETTLRDLSDYSHVLLGGCFLGYQARLEMTANHRIDGIRDTTVPRPRLSAAAYTAFSLSLGLADLPKDWISGIKPWCKLAIGARPPLSEAILRVESENGAARTLAADTNGVRAALALTDAALEKVFSAQGLRYFKAPEGCIMPSGFTDERYSLGGIRFRPMTEPSDMRHMNAAYGAICLAPILDWVLE